MTLVYILPSANKTIAADNINELVNNLSTGKAKSLQIVLGDTN